MNNVKTEQPPEKQSERSISCKKRSELTEQEQEQITSLIKGYITDVSEKYIEDKLIGSAEYDVVLLKDDQQLLAFSYYHLSKQKTPFSGRNVPVLLFGTSMKSRGYKGNTIWKLGNWYGSRYIGRLYMFRKAMGVTYTYNPKVFEQFIKLFPRNYPYTNALTPEIRDFVTEYLRDELKLTFDPDHSFCFFDAEIADTEITADWDKKYKAKSEEINNYFKLLGIIEERDGRIYRTGRHLITCGYRSPLGWI